MTDIYLITGFLGAGKTTLMKNLIKVFKDSKTALIVNEFGKEGVDGTVLKKEGMVIEEIVDGSIFCVCRSDKFIDALLKTKELNADYLIVESSGLADPFGMDEVMDIVNRQSPDSFHYSGSICVIDAKNFKRIYEFAPAAKQQVMGADLILINKTDISSHEEIRSTEEIIRDLNNHATIIETSFAEIADTEQIYSLSWHQPDTKGILLKKTLGISKLKLKFDPVPVDQLTEFLREWSDKTYRVKGFCGKYFVQAVQDEVKISEFGESEEDNFLVVLAPSGDFLRSAIQQSWSKHFSSKIMIS